MAIEKFVGIGTERKEDVFDYVLDILGREKPSIIALDENPIAFSTLIQMRCSRELFNEKFIVDQNHFLLKRELDIGNGAGILYAFRHRHENLAVHFVDGSFREPLSETGEEIGIFPYFSNLDFAASVDLMSIPIDLKKERIPTYAGWDFDYELIHAYQTDARFREMDRAIWQRNQFTSGALNRIIENHDGGVLAFVGHRKRFRYDLYSQTDGVTPEELAQYAPLTQLIRVKEMVIFDAVERKRLTV